MKLIRMLPAIFGMVLMMSTLGLAGDFDWMKDFNIMAEADSSGVRARLETRFQIGDVKIRAVLGNADTAADAYVMLRLGEISGRPMEEVMGKYRSGKHKGWGNLAKSLGIKPGSREFKALKQGHDLHGEDSKIKEKGKGKSHGRKGRK